MKPDNSRKRAPTAWWEIGCTVPAVLVVLVLVALVVIWWLIGPGGPLHDWAAARLRPPQR